MAVVVPARPLREKLGDEAVDSLIELLNKSGEKIKADVIALSGEKYERRLSEEIANIRIDMASLRAELKESEERYEKRLSEEIANIKIDMASLRAELKEDIAGIRTELSAKYASLIKWMFIFWIGQIGAMLGILFAFFKS